MDFESFDIAPPDNTVETNGGVCKDIMQATVNTGYATSVSTVATKQTFNAIPEICGNNQGQHSTKFVYYLITTSWLIFIIICNVRY